MRILNQNAAESFLIKDKILLCCIAFLIVSTYGILKPFSISFLSSLKDLSLFGCVQLLSIFLYIPLLFFKFKIFKTFGTYKSVIFSLFSYGLISFLFFCLASYFSQNDFGILSKIFIILFSLIIEFFNMFTLGIFWSFVHSIVNEDIALNLYPKLILFGQFGCLVASFCYSILSINTYSPLPCLIVLSAFSLSSYLFSFTSSELKINKYDYSKGEIGDFYYSFLRLFKDKYYRLLLLFGVSCEALATIFELIFISRTMLLDAQGSIQIFFIYKFIYSIEGFIFGFLNIDKDKKVQIKILNIIVLLCGLFLILFNSYLYVLLVCASTIKALMHTIGYNISLLFWVKTPLEAKFNTKPWHNLFCKLGSKLLGATFAFLAIKKVGIRTLFEIDIYFLILILLLALIYLIMKFLVKARIEN